MSKDAELVVQAGLLAAGPLPRLLSAGPLDSGLGTSLTVAGMSDSPRRPFSWFVLILPSCICQWFLAKGFFVVILAL